MRHVYLIPGYSYETSALDAFSERASDPKAVFSGRRSMGSASGFAMRQPLPAALPRRLEQLLTWLLTEFIE
jgi:hypothetical protein